ncbi:ABC transporter permease [Ruminiclostridium cellobioparum]|jgi:ABC-2 type transport system permease protein|uniref:ABC transporter permease n=1 Tax=Ruminiclostridium cellobioparum TaxID=29355 RepID=UPI0028A99418|nr:ABC-2 family transporter protein [Ruminiclostridium cellobioparum]
MSFQSVNWVKKYTRVFILGVQSSMEYRTDFLLTIFSAFVPIVIQYFLWSAIFNNSSEAKVYGYTFAQMITYSILSGIFSKLLATGFEWEVASDIKSGGLNKFIVQPIGYFLYRISNFLGGKFINSIVMMFITLSTLVVLKYYLRDQIEIERIFFLLVILFLALLLNFLIFFCVSTLAFWMIEIWQVFTILGIVINVASGGIFPLDIFGKNFLRVIEFLPFKYTIYFPINVISGKLNYDDLSKGILIQLFWVVFLFILSNYLWKKGMKKYVAVGG